MAGDLIDQKEIAFACDPLVFSSGHIQFYKGLSIDNICIEHLNLQEKIAPKKYFLGKRGGRRFIKRISRLGAFGWKIVGKPEAAAPRLGGEGWGERAGVAAQAFRRWEPLGPLQNTTSQSQKNLAFKFPEKLAKFITRSS